jgi:hypothetical protein
VWAREGGSQGRRCAGRPFRYARLLCRTREITRAGARASLLALTPPTGMRALPDPPQHTQRRDLALTSACRRSWSNQPARDDRRSLAPRSRLCSLRRAGECYERYAVPKAQGLMGDEGGGGGGGGSCASRAATATRSDGRGGSRRRCGARHADNSARASLISTRWTTKRPRGCAQYARVRRGKKWDRASRARHNDDESKRERKQPL